MVCNWLPVILVFKYDFSLSLSLSKFRTLISPLSLTAPHTLIKTSNPHIFFISSPNHIKQSAKFFSSHPLQNPPIEIFRNFIKWKNHQRNARVHLLPPSLQANLTVVLSVTLQHQPILPIPHHAHSLCFLSMTNIKGITPSFSIVSFLIPNSLILISLREKPLIVIKFFKTLK